MQQVAAEMNLSETAFLRPEGDDWNLRWFTPTVEVDLCGHATLAAAHVLDRARVVFHTRSGALVAERRGDHWELDFPALPCRATRPPPGLFEALGIEEGAVSRSRFDTIVEVKTESVLRSLEPDFAALAEVDARGVIVTARGDGYDFVSRCFYPAAGIDEDPVTGSAHCALAPYWAERLGMDDMTGYQASRRGGAVRTRVRGDRVFLGGSAVTVVQGELCV